MNEGTYTPGANFIYDNDGNINMILADADGKEVLTIDKDGMKDENGKLMFNNGWISVKDHLPEKDEPVLLIVHGQGYGFHNDIFVGRLHDEPGDDGTHNFFGIKTPDSEWQVLAWSYYKKPEPVYWMPLPKPPKED